MPKYTPKYDEVVISMASTTPNKEGCSAHHKFSIEEGNQRDVAESKDWYLARERELSMGQGDSRSQLEALGFKIVEEAGLFYEVVPPKGWSRESSSYWTTVRDSEGNRRVLQFYKGSLSAPQAYLIFRDGDD